MRNGQEPYIDGTVWVYPDGRRLARVAGGEETEEEKAEREKREAEEQEKREREGAEKPPWGDDANFDPQRAWKLIQDVRSDLDKVKNERDTLRKEKADREEAEKTDEQKREDAKAAAEKTATEAQREAIRLRVALRKGLDETQSKRLVGETEEELEKDADDLVASFKNEDEGGNEGGQEPRRRPQERVRPGAVPSSEPEETDPKKLADAVPRGW